MMMKPDFDRGMKRLQATYGKDLTADEVDAYWSVLQDLSLEDFHEGIRAVTMSDRQFMPRPGQIRKAAGAQRRGNRSWAQNAAGSSKTDPDRATRIGQNLADAEKSDDEARCSYYRTMIDNMDARDRAKADAAYAAEQHHAL